MTRAILNVAVDGMFPVFQHRLVRSLRKVGESASQIMWKNQWPGTPHHETLYGFKVDAFDHALASGVGQALWLDSSIKVVKPLDLVWQVIERDHVLLVGDPAWNCGQWTTDAALSYFGHSRDEAFKIPQIYACVIGVDLTSQVGLEFLAQWRKSRNDGAFAGVRRNKYGQASADRRCLGHRHDQSCASLIAWRMKLPLQDMATFIAIDHGGDPIFRNKGGAE